MALDITGEPQQRRPIGFVLLGVVLLLGAGYLFYDVSRQQETPANGLVEASAYSYTVKQSVDTSVQYFQSSFYEDGPKPNEKAYVSNLTDRIDATLHYNYTATRNAELSSMYSVVASVKSRYMGGSDGKDFTDVWSHEYPLIKPVTETNSGKSIEFMPSATIPFAEYRTMVEQFKTSLAVPVVSDVSLVFTVRVWGTVDGTPFDDIRVSTVSTPLDQPLFTLANKFEKEETKNVLAKQAKQTKDMLRTYEKVAVGILGVLGLLAIIFGMRRQIFKSPYQRELDKIFRLHDGIIIRASKPADLDGKNVVAVRSFDDMLNLEEELKAPIVASPAGGEAMHFVIIHSDVAYVYTLGKVLIEEDSVTAIEEALHPARVQRAKETASPRRRRKIM